MLNQLAFATSLAVLAALMHLLFSLAALISPNAFRFLFDAQFFGADVASLSPRIVPYEGFIGFIGTFIVLVVGSWLSGYAWAWLYNRLVKVF